MNIEIEFVKLNAKIKRFLVLFAYVNNLHLDSVWQFIYHLTTQLHFLELNFLELNQKIYCLTVCFHIYSVNQVYKKADDNW